MKNLENKVAVVYGDGGVGSAIEKSFAREGAKVFLTGRTLTKLDARADEILSGGGAIETAQVDALDEQAVEKHISEIVKKAGGIDISFNAIGIPQKGIQGVPLTGKAHGITKGTPADELKKIMQDRLKTGYYKAPERAGISYMLSPVLRTYFNPAESDGVITMSYPHVMYYAPGVSSEDIGAGELGGTFPFVILPGRHGYMIQPPGQTERAAVNKEYEEMLARLCEIKAEWCLPVSKAQ